MLRLVSVLFAAAISGCVAVNDYGIFTVRDGGGEDATMPRDAGRDGGVDAGCQAVETCGGGDDNCDGNVDEGCPIYFGRPSPMVLAGAPANLRSSWLSPDGRRLYYVVQGATSGTLYVVQRGAITEQFGPPTPVAGTDFSRYAIYDAVLTADEREIFIGAFATGGTNNDIFTATRASSADPFGVLSVVTSAMVGPSHEGAPKLSPDERELFFFGEPVAGVSRLYRARRDARGQPFAPAEAVQIPTFEAQDFTPFLADDGLTLYWARIGTGLTTQRLVRARRTTMDTVAFGAVEDVPELASPSSSNYLFISESTGEAFFTSDRAWSAGTSAIWRVRICRDAPCIEATIDCADGMTSADLRHCYTLGTAGNEPEARQQCQAIGAHLVTVHSAAEHALVQAMGSSFGTATAVWLDLNDAVTEGTYVYSTGEAVTFAQWVPGEPSNLGEQDCTVHLSAANAWDDCQCVGCASAPFALCERELWPW